ncbi:MAG: TlyA family RNA methyltransferase [Deltaproteobacteria bacterium]|nr:TlyA family RNA methyltransferase [Deltaproteobacteria bacterium]MDZ4343384.1 TlyA family RNA methyltransferase [Candidatus Binatia bacterium]
MGKRERLDKLLVERGLVASREQSHGMILAGDVLVDDRPVTKAGSLVDETAVIRLRSRSLPYASRGGTKLEKALEEFQIDIRGKTALDVGASTGGFTDCLLAHGAREVFAVDVGYGQLDWKLRNNPRVRVYEKTNIRYLEVSTLPRPADLATIDASFISLKLILPAVKKLLVPGGEIIPLVKPQFEVGKGKVGKGGVVRSPAEHSRVIDEIKESAARLGYVAREVVESPLLGPKGNKEFFLHLIPV